MLVCKEKKRRGKSAGVQVCSLASLVTVITGLWLSFLWKWQDRSKCWPKLMSISLNSPFTYIFKHAKGCQTRLFWWRRVLVVLLMSCFPLSSTSHFILTTQYIEHWASHYSCPVYIIVVSSGDLFPHWVVKMLNSPRNHQLPGLAISMYGLEWLSGEVCQSQRAFWAITRIETQSDEVSH